MFSVRERPDDGKVVNCNQRSGGRDSGTSRGARKALRACPSRYDASGHEKSDLLGMCRRRGISK